MKFLSLSYIHSFKASIDTTTKSFFSDSHLKNNTFDPLTKSSETKEINENKPKITKTIKPEGFDGYDGFIAGLLPEQHSILDKPSINNSSFINPPPPLEIINESPISQPHFTETKSDNSMLSGSLFSSSIQNELFNTLKSQTQDQIQLNDKKINPIPTENFENEAIEINKKLDNLTKILEGLMKEKNNDDEHEEKLQKNNTNINNNNTSIDNTINEVTKVNQTIIKLSKEESKIEALEDFDSRLEKLKKSIEEPEKETIGDDFRMMEIESFDDDLYMNNLFYYN